MQNNYPAALQGHPNMRQAIHSLPTELLQMIFRCTASDSAPELANECCHSFNRSIILASHISRRWRCVALGDPLLWSFIPVVTSRPFSVEYFQAFIDRSQSHHLTIHIYHNETTDNRQRLCSILDIMNSHGARLTRFSMSGCESITGLFYEKLHFSAPVLESLKLANSPHGSPYTWSFGNLFGGSVPTLRHLTLSGWGGLYPPYAIFSNVTHLTLSSEKVVHIPLASLIELLAQCSRLKHLVLRFLWSGFPPPNTPTSLHRLETLRIDRCDSASILSHLILPSNLNVTIWEEPELSTVMSMPVDCSRLHCLDDIVKVRLVVNLEDMTVTANNRNGTSFEWSQVAYSDSVDGDYDDIIESSVIHILRVSFPRFLPFMGIQEFSIYCEKFEPQSFSSHIPWINIFHNWSVLTTLTLCNFPVEEVMLALIPSSKPFDAIVCPQLDVIQLQISEANLEMFQILTALFTAREIRGCRISSLKMRVPREDYRTYKDEIRVLKDSVRNMQVQRL